MLVALSGVRIIEAIGAMQGGGAVMNAVAAGADIVISGGLMAGGAALFHEIAETLRGTIRQVSRAVSGRRDAGAATAAQPDSVTSQATVYEITVTRETTDTGRLTFSHGGVMVSTTCWWDPGNAIGTGNYTACSKTRMATKRDSVTGLQRPGIFLPSAVSPRTGRTEIFIHEGRDPSWSDGCIVIDRDEMMRMWNHIEPSDGMNVTVRVSDAT